MKANAFSNDAGIVVDTFYFTDRFRTLEMNLQEWERLKKSIAAVSERRGRPGAHAPRSPEVGKDRYGTKVKIADADRIRRRLLRSQHAGAGASRRIVPDLLYRMCSLVSKHECNIEIALIETEGQMAIDVFYLTSAEPS